MKTFNLFDFGIYFRKSLLLLLLVIIEISSAQVPSGQNKLNADGTKDGTWIVMFDSAYENIVQDTSLAHYYCVVNYDNGKLIGQSDCFYKSGIKQFRGRLLTLKPETKHGQVYFYNKAGILEQKVRYVNDTIEGPFVGYHPNGLVQALGDFERNDRIGAWEYYLPSGSIQAKGDYVDGKENGVWEFYHPNGKLQSKGYLKDAKYQGEWQFYYESGQLNEVANFVDNKRNGLVTAYFENGQLNYKGNYLDNQQHDQFTFHHENGRIQSEGKISQGNYQGPWVFYFDNGNIKSNGDFVEDAKNGSWKFYYENGQLESAGTLDDGLWVDSAWFYHENGQPSSKGIFEDDLKDGLWYGYNESGVLNQKSTFAKGKLNGYQTNFNDAGTVILSEGNYELDEKTGSWTYRYDNGNLKSVGAYEHGKRTDHWSYYFENGTKKSAGPYSNDQRQGEWFYYFEGAGLYAKGLYHEGNTVGTWEYYYKSGELRRKGPETADKKHGRWEYFDESGLLTEFGNWNNGEKTGQWTYYSSPDTIIKMYENGEQVTFNSLYNRVVALSFQADKGNEILKLVYRAEDIYYRDFPKNHIKKTDVYCLYGLYFDAIQDYKRSVKYYKKALKFASSVESDTSEWFTLTLRDLGNLQFNYGFYNDALKSYEHQLQLVSNRKQGNVSPEYRQSFVYYCNTLSKLGRRQEALAKIESQVEAAKESKANPALMLTYYEALVDYVYELRQPVYCNSLCLQAENLISTNSLKLSKAEGTIHYYKGMLAYDTMSYASAKKEYLTAAKTLESVGSNNSPLYVDCFLKAGDFYYVNGNHDSTLLYYHMAAKKIDSLKLQGQSIYPNVTLSLARAYWRNSSYAESEDYYELTRNTLENGTFDKPNLLSQVYLGLACAEEQRNQKPLESTENYFLRSLELVEGIPEYFSKTINTVFFYSDYLTETKRDHSAAISLCQNLLQTGKENINYTDRAEIYYRIGTAYYKAYQYDSANYYFDQSHQAIRNTTGRRDRLVIDLFFVQARIQRDLGNFELAQRYNLEALDSSESYFGQQSYFYGHSLDELADHFNHVDNYATARTYYKKAIDLRKSLHDTLSTVYWFSYVSYAKNELEDGNWQFATQLLEEAENYYANYPAQFVDYLRCFENKAKAFERGNQFAQAEASFLRMLDVSRKHYKTENAQFASELREVAQFYSRQYRYDQALLYAQKGIELIRDDYQNTVRYAWYAETLSWILIHLDKAAQALIYQQEALDIYEVQLGLNSSQYLESRKDMSNILVEAGQYNKAIVEYQEYINQIIELNGRLTYEVPEAYVEMGSLYWERSNPEKGLEYLNLAKLMFDSLQVDRSNYPGIYNMIGLCEFDLGNYKKSREAYNKAIQIGNNVWDPTAYSLSIYNNNLAFCDLIENDLQTAESRWTSVKKTIASENESNLQQIKWLDNMAALYTTWNKYDKAQGYWEKALELIWKDINSEFPYLTESGKAALWDVYKDDFEYFMSFGVKAFKNGDNEVVGDLYNNQLQTKSLLVTTSTKERRRILNSGDSNMVALYFQYLDLKKELSRIIGENKTSTQPTQNRIKTISDKCVQIERLLSLNSEQLRKEEKSQSIDWKQIRKALKPGEAAVEIVRFRHFDKIVSDSVLYAALIVTSNSKKAPDLIILPNGDELEQKYIKAYRNSIKNKIVDSWSFDQFWKPIHEALNGINQVYFAPDGIYHQMNIATLLGPEGKYMMEHYGIRQLTSSREIIELKNVSKKANEFSAYLFGFPKYDLDSTNIKKIIDQKGLLKNDEQTRGTIRVKDDIPELPGTKIETQEISTLLATNGWETNLLLGENAIEEELKRVPHPTVLHIATHGFFEEEQNQTSNLTNTRSGNLDLSYSKNPLHRSGLLMAGAASHLHSSSYDNGILTAYEAMDMDLNNTSLVVLSACETGLGEIKNGEGVYGLQRAFQIAGSNAIMMSLWKVSDEATQMLMTKFYEAWLSGIELHEALQIARNHVKTKFPAPYYWGAFELVE